MVLEGWKREVSCRSGQSDERSQTDILTPGVESHSRLPNPLPDQWQWEFASRYSGATVPDSHGVP